MKDKILELIDNELPSPYKERMKQLVQPIIRINTNQTTELLPIGSSKFGGLPDLPKGTEWPYAEDDDQHFRFVAQFNFADIPQCDSGNYFPETGMIYFFVCYSSLGKVIVSFDSTDDLIRLDKPPESLLSVRRKSFLQRLFKPKPEKQIYRECSVDFSIEYSLPTADSFYTYLIEKENPNAKKPYDAFSEEYTESIVKQTNTGDNVTDHHFFGYAIGIQQSYKEYEIQKDIKTKISELTSDQIESLLDWTLLCQIDSDPKADMMWGDVGRFYFYIRKADLKAKRFNDIRSTMDCY